LELLHAIIREVALAPFPHHLLIRQYDKVFSEHVLIGIGRGLLANTGSLVFDEQLRHQGTSSDPLVRQMRNPRAGHWDRPTAREVASTSLTPIETALSGEMLGQWPDIT
jgi:hypothetical protein